MYLQILKNLGNNRNTRVFDTKLEKTLQFVWYLMKYHVSIQAWSIEYSWKLYTHHFGLFLSFVRLLCCLAAKQRDQKHLYLHTRFIIFDTG